MLRHFSTSRNLHNYISLVVRSPDSDRPSLSSFLTKTQASSLANAEQINKSPSMTMLNTVNNSGSYICSTSQSNLEMQSPSTVLHYYKQIE